MDPEATIGDLVGRLGDDGKRLLKGEVRLAKLERGEGIHEAGRGLLWMGVAFGFSVVALSGLTIGATVVLGRLFDALWLGALATAVVELAIGGWLLLSGLKTIRAPAYTLPQARQELALTARVVRSADAR
jgi:uncharacterized membrane protein YqjE